MNPGEGSGTVTGQPQTLDMATHGQLLVPLKGFEKPVPLEQVAEGFMRHSDYTNKTQQLATDRQEIASQQEEFNSMKKWFDAINADPVNGIRQLQRAYNVSPESVSVDGELEEVDPKVASLEAQLNSLKSQLAASTEVSADRTAALELEKLFPDMDISDVKAYMAAKNMASAEPDRIIDAAKLMTFDRQNEERQMALEAQNARVEVVNTVKRELPPVSSGAAPTLSPDLLPSQAPELPSFEQAYELAQAEIIGQTL